MALSVVCKDKPMKLSLVQTIRATAGAEMADRQRGRIARSTGESQGEMGLGRVLNTIHAVR
jgi:hypothetical protein